MTTTKVSSKLKNAISARPQREIDAQRFRLENRDWLRRSMEIALLVMDRLDELKWTQKRFAEELSVSPQQVNKIVKGQENLSLSTITKLEVVLGIILIKTPFEAKKSTQEKEQIRFVDELIVSISNTNISYTNYRSSKAVAQKFRFMEAYYAQTLNEPKSEYSLANA